MTEQHPLTDETCYQLWQHNKANQIERQEPFARPPVTWLATQRLMRATADWQLEQVMEWLEENLDNYTDDDYLGDCEPIYKLGLDLKKAMRPIQDGSEGQDRAFNKLIENNSAALTELADS